MSAAIVLERISAPSVCACVSNVSKSLVSAVLVFQGQLGGRAVQLGAQLVRGGVLALLPLDSAALAVLFIPPDFFILGLFGVLLLVPAPLEAQFQWDALRRRGQGGVPVAAVGRRRAGFALYHGHAATRRRRGRCTEERGRSRGFEHVFLRVVVLRGSGSAVGLAPENVVVVVMVMVITVLGVEELFVSLVSVFVADVGDFDLLLGFDVGDGLHLHDGRKERKTMSEGLKEDITKNDLLAKLGGMICATILRFDLI